MGEDPKDGDGNHGSACQGEFLCLMGDLDATEAVGIERDCSPFEIVVVRGQEGGGWPI